MADTDPISSALAPIRERQAKATAREGDAALWIGAMGRLTDEDVPRLLAAVDAVLALHSPRSDRVLGSSCFTHRDKLNTMRPVQDCGECTQDRQREVCPECRDEFGDPVPFGDCRARAAALAALTGKGESGDAGRG